MMKTVLEFIPCQFDSGTVLKEAFISVLIKYKCEEKYFNITKD